MPLTSTMQGPFCRLLSEMSNSFSLGHQSSCSAHAPSLGGLKSGPYWKFSAPSTCHRLHGPKAQLRSWCTEEETYQSSVRLPVSHVAASLPVFHTPLLSPLRLIGVVPWNQDLSPVALATARSCLARATGQSDLSSGTQIQHGCPPVYLFIVTIINNGDILSSFTSNWLLPWQLSQIFYSP